MQEGCIMSARMCSQERKCVPMHRCILVILGFFLHFLVLEYIITMILQATFYTKEVDYVMKLTMAAYGAHWSVDEGVSDTGSKCQTSIRDSNTPSHLSTISNFDIRLMTTTTAYTPRSHWRRASAPKIWNIRVFTFIFGHCRRQCTTGILIYTESDSLRQLQFRPLLAKELMDFSFAINLTIESGQGGEWRLWLPFVGWKRPLRLRQIRAEQNVSTW